MGQEKPREIIGVNVRRLRSHAGLTQAQLAEAADVSDETISRIERGAYEPSVMTACAVASALRVTVEDLVRPGARSAHPVALPDPLRALTGRALRLGNRGQRALLKVADLLLTLDPRGGQPKAAVPSRGPSRRRSA